MNRTLLRHNLFLLLDEPSQSPRLAQLIPAPPHPFAPAQIDSITSLISLTHCVGEVAKEVGIDNEERVTLRQLAPFREVLQLIVTLLKGDAVNMDFEFTVQDSSKQDSSNDDRYVVALPQCIAYGSKAVVAFFSFFGTVEYFGMTDEGKKRFVLKAASVELARLTYVDRDEATQAWLVEQQKQIVSQ